MAGARLKALVSVSAGPCLALLILELGSGRSESDGPSRARRRTTTGEQNEEPPSKDDPDAAESKQTAPLEDQAQIKRR